MKKIIIFTVLSLLTFPLCFSAEKTEPIGTIIKITGKLELKNAEAESWQIATVGMQIFEGDFVRTDEFARSEIVFTDATRIKIAPNSEIVLKLRKLPRDEKTKKKERPINQLKMSSGDIWGKVKKGNTKLEIETPSAVAAVKGTELGVLVDKKKNTTLIVYEGLVEFKNDKGSVMAKASQTSTASQTAPPSAPAQTDTSSSQTWINTVEAKGELKINLNKMNPVNSAFNAAVSAVDNNKQLDSGNSSVVTISSNSTKLEFSKDKKTWANSIAVNLLGGFGSFFARASDVGGLSISATSNDLSPCTESVDIMAGSDVKPKDLVIKIKTKTGVKTIILKYKK